RKTQADHANQRRRFARKLTQLQEAHWFNAELLRDAIGQVIGKLSPLFAPATPSRLKVMDASQRKYAATAAVDDVKFKRTRPKFVNSSGSREHTEPEASARHRARRYC
ncbi:hypothetical protein PPH41_29670, partial [Burkholderia gladioli]|nr:hypothetical protein [Burkholderia gladioli]